ncbi:MAG: hypothetical protein H7287_00165 [Thermoleophilia bacterium]|nr:hypothetical protein [Thermoleophilia bacterium]
MEAHIRTTPRQGETIEVGMRDFRAALATLTKAAAAGTPVIIMRPDGVRLRLGLERDLETPLERAVREGRARLATASREGWDGTPTFVGRSKEHGKGVMDYLREDRE